MMLAFRKSVDMAKLISKHWSPHDSTPGRREDFAICGDGDGENESGSRFDGIVIGPDEPEDFRDPERDSIKVSDSNDMPRQTWQAGAVRKLSKDNAGTRETRDNGASKNYVCECTVGIVYREEDSVITQVVAGGPAYYSKLVFQGDSIVAIDGSAVHGYEIVDHLRGPAVPGSVVQLSLMRKSGVVEQVQLQRMATRLFENHAFDAIQAELKTVQAELAQERERSQAKDLQIQDVQMTGARKLQSVNLSLRSDRRKG